jgi:hypothetical protein
MARSIRRAIFIRGQCCKNGAVVGYDHDGEGMAPKTKPNRMWRSGWQGQLCNHAGKQRLNK